MNYADTIISFLDFCLFSIFCNLFCWTFLGVNLKKEITKFVILTFTFSIYLFATYLLHIIEPFSSLIILTALIFIINQFHKEKSKTVITAALAISYSICITVYYLSIFIASFSNWSWVTYDILGLIINIIIFFVIFNFIKKENGIKKLLAYGKFGFYLALGIIALVVNTYFSMIYNASIIILFFMYFVVFLMALTMVVFAIYADRKSKEIEKAEKERRENQQYMEKQTKLMEEILLNTQKKEPTYNYHFQNNSDPIERAAHEIMGNLEVKRSNGRYKLFMDALCKVAKLPRGEVPNMSKIHEEVAKEHGTNADSVKQSLRRVAIEAVDTRTSDFEKVCPVQIMDKDGNVDTKTFIFILSEKVKEKIAEESA